MTQWLWNFFCVHTDSDHVIQVFIRLKYDYEAQDPDLLLVYLLAHPWFHAEF